MIEFKFSTETHINGKVYGRTLYWVGAVNVTDTDEEHRAEIYEQLDVQTCGLDDFDELEDWNWPYLRMADGKEYSCPHGVGHSEGVHGCEGCCSHASFKKRAK